MRDAFPPRYTARLHVSFSRLIKTNPLKRLFDLSRSTRKSKFSFILRCYIRWKSNFVYIFWRRDYNVKEKRINVWLFEEVRHWKRSIPRNQSIHLWLNIDVILARVVLADINLLLTSDRSVESSTLNQCGQIDSMSTSILGQIFSLISTLNW